MSATNTGEEEDTFMPPLMLGAQTEGIPAVGMTLRVGDETHQRLTLQGGAAVSAWTIANTVAQPGETIDGVILFEISPDDIIENDGNIETILTVSQSEDYRIRFDLDEIFEEKYGEEE